jgi:hypothetical protein
MGIEAGIGAIIVGAIEGTSAAAVTAAGGLGGLAAAAINIGVSLGIGTALGAISQSLHGNDAAQTNRAQNEIVYTTSIRALPVAVLFGRGRMVGNMIALGDYIRIATLPTGSYLQVEKGIVGIGEGPFQVGGNFKIDGQTGKQQSLIVTSRLIFTTFR